MTVHSKDDAHDAAHDSHSSSDGHSHDSHDHNDSHGHDDSHGHAPAGDIIPESSMQDMLLKLVTVVAAVGLIGMFGWWWTLPLPEGHAEGHGEGQSHDGQVESPASGFAAPAEHH